MHSGFRGLEVSVVVGKVRCMTSTAPAACGALASLVDVLVAEPLNGVDVPGLQARVRLVSAQVSRLQGWVTAAAGA